MKIRMRILQKFHPVDEAEFMRLERLFMALEQSNPDLPQGRRFKPLAGAEPCNTLVWEGDFESLEAAHRALSSFSGNEEHERLLAEQIPFFREARIEFLEAIEPA